MAVAIRDDNTIPDILRELEELGRSVVEVGVFEDQDTTILLIATVNEFGCEIVVTEKMRRYLIGRSRELGLKPGEGGLYLKVGSKIRIPERSFIRTGFDNSIDEVQRKADEILSDVVAGRAKAGKLLSFIGIELQGAIIEQIRRGEFVPNHPFTIASKSTSAGKGDQPLMNTGKLASPAAIKWRIVQK